MDVGNANWDLYGAVWSANANANLPGVSGVGEDACTAESYPVMNVNYNSPGTWTITSTSTPASVPALGPTALLFLGTGLVGLLAIKQRNRSQQSSKT
jgi:hypothetical protein